MGCSSSKLVVDDSGISKPVEKPPPSAGRRQARMSLAVTYCQLDLVKAEQPTISKSSGVVIKKTSTLLSSGNVLQVQYAFVSQRGYYPDQPDKSNQDAVAVHESIGDREDIQFFGVFDGHGEFGTECAQYAAQMIPEHMATNLRNNTTMAPDEAIRQATLTTNTQLHRSDDIDDSLSGTTACVAVIQDLTVHVANVGDSRAVLAVRDNEGKLTARDLSVDQTPFRQDECDRVKKAGARVLTLDQVEGLKDMDDCSWTNEDDCDGDPPRLWAQDGTYPGTAFTRSIGDNAAEAIGVCADPEMMSMELGSDCAFLIVASDGVWEFISSRRAVDVVSQFTNPQDAANALVATAYKAWLQRETRTDDISVVLLYFKYPSAASAAASS